MQCARSPWTVTERRKTRPPALARTGNALNGTEHDAGDVVEVEWLKFIRPEQKFDSVEALQAQIEKDCEAARAMFA